jgi:chromosome segregation ATPase
VQGSMSDSSIMESHPGAGDKQPEPGTGMHAHRGEPVAGGSNSQDSNMAQVFREKAKQMYEMAKALQLEKTALQKELFALKRGQVAEMEEIEQGSASTVNMQMDDLLKKVDRLTRALESEKQKVKMLSDRVTVAEKEAQSASPLIEDLEAKVETTLKNSQQYKKETEAVKQKLVQAEAEKNKIKNELIKAQAQIQTLNKRLAG